MEHYCTLFDLNYLPQGMAMHASLMEQAGDFQLWILCMDQEVEDALRRLALPRTRLFPIRDLETAFPPLRSVRGSRNNGEYCWTATPFLPEGIFAQAPEIERITYLDADLFFFGSPDLIFAELETSGAHALITEHSYSPEFDHTALAGRFNVQFMPFRNTPESRKILQWWQDRCLEWCYGRYEDGKFGDQKYLDQWPELFGGDVHVLRDVTLTLGPWNVLRLWSPDAPKCLFHYHGLRMFQDGEVRLHQEYKNTFEVGRKVYKPYLRVLRDGYATRTRLGIRDPHPVPVHGWGEAIRRLRRLRRRMETWGSVAPTRMGRIRGWLGIGT
jgi:hypothetical protein